MVISPECKVATYLTGHFGKSASENSKPLSPTEWTRLKSLLAKRDIPIADLLKTNPEDVIHGADLNSVTPCRIKNLLDKSTSMSFQLEEWIRAGLWVVTKSDPQYPKLMIDRLGDGAPPVLYGCGNLTPLTKYGVAIVGSRNAVKEDLEFASSLAKELTNYDYSIISGGAKGIDQSAMQSALDAEGDCVGVLASDLFRAATSSLYRNLIMSGRLVLVSPFHPEAKFSRGSAMARNKHIYCLAQCAVVVACVENRGGSWHGAENNLKASWAIPLWVRKTGNAALVEKGAGWLSDDGAQLIDDAIKNQCNLNSNENAESTCNLHFREVAGDGYDTDASSAEIRKQESEFYEIFIRKTRKFLSDGPRSITEIYEFYYESDGITKPLVRNWLKRATEETIIMRHVRPVRYSLPDDKRTEQLTLNI